LSPAISPTRRFLRVTTRFVALTFCVFACLLEHLFNAITGKTSLAQRPYPLHRWSARLLPWIGVRIECQGTPPDQGLIVSNHLSYLDILVFSTVVPCAFVAKKEVKSWPGVGWIATLTGTVYIDRARRTETHSVQPKIAASLAAGVRLILFPEGTSSDGRQVLPFRSSLFQPAVENRAPITAACISYEMGDGDPAIDVCYYGDMVLGPHAAKLFGKGAVKATVRFGEHARVFSDRKDAAREIYEEVSALKSQPASVPCAATAAI
jgi:1-acyl-sn-glycerol-3-phosphate acyltransferase